MSSVQGGHQKTASLKGENSQNIESSSGPSDDVDIPSLIGQLFLSRDPGHVWLSSSTCGSGSVCLPTQLSSSLLRLHMLVSCSSFSGPGLLSPI